MGCEHGALGLNPVTCSWDSSTTGHGWEHRPDKKWSTLSLPLPLACSWREPRAGKARPERLSQRWGEFGSTGCSHGWGCPGPHVVGSAGACLMRQPSCRAGSGLTHPQLPAQPLLSTLPQALGLRFSFSDPRTPPTESLSSFPTSNKRWGFGREGGEWALRGYGLDNVQGHL